MEGQWWVYTKDYKEYSYIRLKCDYSKEYGYHYYIDNCFYGKPNENTNDYYDKSNDSIIINLYMKQRLTKLTRTIDYVIQKGYYYQLPSLFPCFNFNEDGSVYEVDLKKSSNGSYGHYTYDIKLPTSTCLMVKKILEEWENIWFQRYY